MIDNPEILAIAVVVVATKLYHPFPGEKRAPMSHLDPSIASIDWPEWRKAMALRKGSGTGLEVGTEHLFGVNEAMVADNAQLDDFMDWMERTWIGAEDPKSRCSIIAVESSPC
jgi:hypothetical protein